MFQSPNNKTGFQKRPFSAEETTDIKTLYTPDTYKWKLSEDLKKFAKKELREDEKTREHALLQLRNWINKTNYIRNCRIDSNFLLRFLRVKKFSVPLAQETITKYILMRQQNPYWFHGLTMQDPMVDDLINRGVAFALPGRDKSGRRVMFTIGGGIDPDYHTSEAVVRALMLTYESFLEDEETQIRGFAHILDESGVQMSHLVLWNPAEIAKLFGICEKGMPMRHKRVDFVKLPMMLNYLFEFVMNFMSEKLRSRIFLHKTQTNLLDAVDGKILPKEYGGTIPMAEMIQQFKDEIRARNHRIQALDKLEIDIELMKKSAEGGKCGQGIISNVGLAGSFKKLEID